MTEEATYVRPSLCHHDFKEEVTELIEDFGLSPNEAHAVARGWINDLSASNPHLYNILEANHAHGCKTCKKDLTARVKLFSNRIRINAEPVAMPEPPSPPKLPNTTEKSAGSNPYFDDPSGRNGIYIRIPIPYSRDIRDVLVKPGTPEHQNLDKSIRNHLEARLV